MLRFFDQQTGSQINIPLKNGTVWLQVHANFKHDWGQFSYSLDGNKFIEIGDRVELPYQLKTFQGVRYALFAFNEDGKEGGYADFNQMSVEEPRHLPLTQPIPYDSVISLTNLADSTVLVNWRNHLRPVDPNSPFTREHASGFRVLDRGNGRIALQSVSSGGYVTVKGQAGMAEVRIEQADQGDASTFQWVDLLDGTIVLMSLYNHCYLNVDPGAGSLCSADAKGAQPDRKGGACFSWKTMK